MLPFRATPCEDCPYRQPSPRKKVVKPFSDDALQRWADKGWHLCHSEKGLACSGCEYFTNTGSRYPKASVTQQAE